MQSDTLEKNHTKIKQICILKSFPKPNLLYTGKTCAGGLLSGAPSKVVEIVEMKPLFHPGDILIPPALISPSIKSSIFIWLSSENPTVLFRQVVSFLKGKTNVKGKFTKNPT
jgi:hypothetical protein